MASPRIAPAYAMRRAVDSGAVPSTAALIASIASRSTIGGTMTTNDAARMASAPRTYRQRYRPR
jgi:hypothetical protein